MNLHPVSSPHWKELYQAALFEIDAHQLLMRINEAERAIRDRANELLASAEDSERQALADALAVMCDLRRMNDNNNNAQRNEQVSGEEAKQC